MLPDTNERVSRNTADEINEQIRERTRQNVEQMALMGPLAINRRLAELDSEWDTERTLGTVAPTLSLIGLALGVTSDRRWLLLPAVVQAFLLQHALQGWCPPLPVLRRLGVRTAAEIGAERYALKALRGDFQGVETGPFRAENALEAATEGSLATTS